MSTYTLRSSDQPGKPCNERYYKQRTPYCSWCFRRVPEDRYSYHHYRCKDCRNAYQRMQRNSKKRVSVGKHLQEYDRLGIMSGRQADQAARAVVSAYGGLEQFREECVRIIQDESDTSPARLRLVSMFLQAFMTSKQNQPEE